MTGSRELDQLKKQVLAYIRQNIESRDERHEAIRRSEELFKDIRTALEGTAGDFEAEVTRRAEDMRVTPGVEWRRIRWSVGGLRQAFETRTRVSQIEQIKGIGAFFAQRFKDVGVSSPEDLLRAGASPRGRRVLADKVGVAQRKILAWVKLADLMRVKGVGEEYTALLQAAGIDTVPELAQRNPENLHRKMIAVNERRKLVRRVPSQAEVVSWVAQAKELPRVIQY